VPQDIAVQYSLLLLKQWRTLNSSKMHWGFTGLPKFWLNWRLGWDYRVCHVSRYWGPDLHYLHIMHVLCHGACHIPHCYDRSASAVSWYLHYPSRSTQPVSLTAMIAVHNPYHLSMVLHWKSSQCHSGHTSLPHSSQVWMMAFSYSSKYCVHDPSKSKQCEMGSCCSARQCAALMSWTARNAVFTMYGVGSFWLRKDSSYC
jgi:hypothetical protein